MVNRFILTLTVLAICACALPALADWNPEDPYTKWVQMPDPNGWDVKVTAPKVLADDFLCTSLDPITDIHLWGSWRHDDIGQITSVHLSIHTDDVTGDFSKPGILLWEKDIAGTDINVVPWGTDLQGWLDPNCPDQYIESDHWEIWQVNIFLDREDWFWQQGTEEEPIVYWLDVSVTVEDPDTTEFGWKTSITQWRDDAVWADIPATGEPDWRPLTDPITGASLDLAFVITTIPEPGILALVGLGLLALLKARGRK